MMTTITVKKSAVTTLKPAKALALLSIGALGAILVGGVGFAGAQSVHDAVHDVRHVLSFPCH